MHWFPNFHFVQLFYVCGWYISYNLSSWNYVNLLQQICIITMLYARSLHGCGGFAFYTLILYSMI